MEYGSYIHKFLFHILRLHHHHVRDDGGVHDGARDDDPRLRVYGRDGARAHLHPHLHVFLQLHVSK